jgi:hypothetical protein
MEGIKISKRTARKRNEKHEPEFKLSLEKNIDEAERMLMNAYKYVEFGGYNVDHEASWIH